MPAPDDQGQGQAELRRQLATLVFSEVGPSGSAEAVQAVAWLNMLRRVGLRPPLVAVHDLGLLLAQARDGRAHQLLPAPRASSSSARQQYRALLAAVATSELTESLATTTPRDDTIVVIIARVLSDVYLRWPGAPRPSAAPDLPLA